MKASDKTRAALRVLWGQPTMAPGEFARRLWDTRHWAPHAVGKTGGAYLWTLKQGGFITGDQTLTAKGLEAIGES